MKNPFTALRSSLVPRSSTVKIARSLVSIERSLASIDRTLTVLVEQQFHISVADSQFGNASKDTAFVHYPDREENAKREEALQLAHLFSPDLAVRIEQDLALGGHNALEESPEAAELRRALEEAEEAVQYDEGGVPI